MRALWLGITRVLLPGLAITFVLLMVVWGLIQLLGVWPAAVIGLGVPFIFLLWVLGLWIEDSER